MLLRLLLLSLPLIQLCPSHPVFTIQDKEGATYSLNNGQCEEYSCGSDERRGICVNELYKGRQAHYCKCNLPFTGQFCDETLRLNASLASSRYVLCPFPLYCASMYNNGECNEECNTDECLYDGYDCLLLAKCPSEEFCKGRYGDGFCDEECMREECQFDGGDCDGRLDTLPGQLNVRLSVTSSDFLRLSHLFLFHLSRFLRSTVVISHDSFGPLIWKWNEMDGRGERIAMKENSSIGIEVALSVDISHCSSECFQSISTVVDFLNQAISSNALPQSSPLSALLSASSHPTVPSSLINPINITMFALCLLVAIMMIITGFTIKHRKRTLEAPIWKIPVVGDTAAPAQSIKKRKFEPRLPTVLHKMAASEGPFRVTDADDVNACDDKGRTPLLCAVASNRRDCNAKEVVNQLLEAGADIRAVDEDGWSVLHYSLYKLRAPSFTQWVISKGANPCAIDNQGQSLLLLATQYDDAPNLQILLCTEAVRLIDCPSNSNRTPLMIAVADCSLNTAKVLIDSGASVNYGGDMVLDTAVATRFPLHIAVQHNNKDHVRLLNTHGVSRDLVDHRERSALHYAVMYSDLEMVRILVEDVKVPVDLKDDENRTAEQIARDWEMKEILGYLENCRGFNEVGKKAPRKKKATRYSSDQGYGSEESVQCPSSPIPREDSPPLAPLMSPPKYTLPGWAQQCQLPLFNQPFTPLTHMTYSTDMLHKTPNVLTPCSRVLFQSTASLASTSKAPRMEYMNL